MPYALVDVELNGPCPAVALGPGETGVALVSRRDGRVVGFALHERPAGAVLAPVEVAALLDPAPGPGPAPELDPAPGPSITVAVCTRDRTELLGRCLEGLRSLDPPPDEVMVVDNAPADGGTCRLVAGLDGVRYETEPCPGLDVARNRALRAAAGDVVAFVDDDVVVDRHWLAGLRAAWAEHPDAGAVTGQILPWELATDAQVAFERRGGFRGGNLQVRYAGQHRAGDPTYPYGAGSFGAGANMAFRRRAALRLGGFDEALDTGPPLPGGGDIDLMHRALRAGLPLVYEPRAVVFHRHRRDAAGLRRQYDSWGRSLMAFVVKTYRRDPPGRPKLRRLVRWFFRHQAGEALRGPGDGRGAAVAELWGGVGGLAGTYGRSVRRTGRLRRSRGQPTVAILPWGDVMEDYTGPIGLSLDDYADRLTGGWLFGFVAALARAGVGTVVVLWSKEVVRPTRRIHLPTGATLWFLPPSPAYRAARARLHDPYAWDRRSAVAPGRRLATLAGTAAHTLAPYLSTTPVRLAAVLRQEGCRAVLCQDYEEGRFDLCIALGRLLRLPVFATFQGGDHTRTRLERLVRRRSVRAAAGLVVADPREADRVRRRYGVPSCRIASIPNPLDPSTVPLRPRAEARAALGLGSEARVALWHGRVDIRPKGLDTLVEAWRKVRADATVPVTLLLLGTGSGAGWLRGRIDELGLDDVLWRDEHVLDRQVIGTWLSAADVYVLPSRQEGFPVAPVEAMAAGLAVVATDAPGVRAVVGEGEAAGGVVVAREDASALARELGRFLHDGELARATGRRAARRAAECFSLDAVGARLRALVIGP